MLCCFMFKCPLSIILQFGTSLSDLRSRDSMHLQKSERGGGIIKGIEDRDDVFDRTKNHYLSKFITFSNSKKTRKRKRKYTDDQTCLLIIRLATQQRY